MSSPATLSTPPIQQPFLGKNGLVTPIWVSWLNTLYFQAGGSTGVNLIALQSAVTTLQGNVATLNNDITNTNEQLAVAQSWAQLEAVGPRL